MTAISPRAVLDVVFVVAQIVRLVRRIAEIYGGRPGLLGLIKLARSIGAHIAITGGMAVGDSLLQQLVGHGIASRISARMGEGVLNGLLTARVGLSALAVCRPRRSRSTKPPASPRSRRSCSAAAREGDAFSLSVRSREMGGGDPFRRAIRDPSESVG